MMKAESYIPRQLLDLPQKIKNFVNYSLIEDISKGDITSETFIKPNIIATGNIVVKEDAYLCGISVAREVFNQIDPKIKFEQKYNDGSFLRKGAVVATVTGRARTILKCERVALNFLQRLSGVATTTRQYVNKVEKYGVNVLDTRKTTPNWRFLEKYAVRIGGGMNHRFDLHDAVLIKDNHLRLIKNLKRLEKDILRLKKKVKFIEIEAQNKAQAYKFCELPVDVIMLDNIEPSELKKITKYIKKKKPELILEASGGIKLTNIEQFARTGVDWLSVGAITHSYRSINFCLDIKY